MMRIARWASLVCGCLVLGACGKSGDQPGNQSDNKSGAGKTPAGYPAGLKAEQPFTIEAATVVAHEITPAVRAPGTIEAFETVQISARVAGVLDRLAVAEGDLVAVGDVIAAIDGERYRLALVTAQAQHQRALAVREDAGASAARRDELAKLDRVPQEEAQQARLRLAQAAADLAIAEAAVARATLDVHEATVRAPIAGVIQRREARTGAYLSVGAPLATLVQREPLEVRFSVPVADAQILALGNQVTATPRDGAHAVQARIHFIADAVDSGTRLVTVMARLMPDEIQTDDKKFDKVAGTKRLVRPGTFVAVSISQPSRIVLTIPSLAVRSSERGTVVYVVDGGVVHERLLTLDGQADNGDLLVRAGLQAGEQVAVRAADGLRDGMKVVVKPRGQATSSVPVNAGSSSQ